ncbi:transposase InsO family protein [Nonomuraea dietziae]|uniref:Transposase InsO family protein n=2 Tax=Nonomuraea dietziae TaxID=65515 RepID=A0A7W5VAM9_9ACTN|nr:transposase InsO family protein [Nonomuraea dietziae]
MKNYPPEFKRDAVALYESRPGATIAGVGADLGISSETLRNWIRAARQERGESGRPGRRPQAGDSGGEASLEAVEAENAALRRRVRELEEGPVFRRGDALVNRFQFVAKHAATFGVKRLCGIVGIARSSFYHWLSAAPARAERQRRDEALAEQIRAIHAEHDGTYGSPRITAELRERGRLVNRKRVERIMRAFAIVGVHLRKKIRTTLSEASGRRVPDLLQRDFTADVPNRRYVGDITYLPIADGTHLYLATVIDLCSRKLAGWSITDHMRTDLVAEALRAAARDRGRLDGAIFHSDHGAQYSSKQFAELCSELGVVQSMGAVGSSADNAAAESFNATLKRETLQGRTSWPTARHARLEVFRWASRYNTRRRHSKLGQRAPQSYETAFRSTSSTLAPAA